MSKAMSRIDDVVRLSGVSRSTVFRFLRGQNVRPAFRSSILTAMRELDMDPRGHSVHKGKTLLISVRPAFQSFKGYDLSISGFMARAEAHGFHCRLKAGNAADDPVGTNSPVAGVLFLGRTIQEEDEESARLREQGVPYVFVNRVFEDSCTSWVSVDHHVAARDAVMHLFELGFDRVGTWGRTNIYRVDREKRVGYLRAHAERGLPIPESCLEHDTHGDLEDAVEALIAARRMPPAWFASSDEHAIRLIKVLRRHGMAVPDDVAVVGMDDAGQAEFMNPALTTIHMPFRAAGTAAFEVLRHLIENPEDASMRVVLRHRLVVRESCGAAARRAVRVEQEAL